MAPISIATIQDTSVDLNWEWAKHRPKQLSSGKRITLVGGYWKMKIMTWWLLFCRYILKVPFDNEEQSGIVYVWIGSKADPEEARLIEEIAEEIFNDVSIPFKCIYIHYFDKSQPG